MLFAFDGINCRKNYKHGEDISETLRNQKKTKNIS